MTARAKVVRTGGGRFDPDEDFVFFIAMNSIAIGVPYHPWTLLGVDALMGNAGMAELRARTSQSTSKTFLDSGVFHLATRHAEAHGLTMDEALRVAPEQIDQFDRFLAKYIEVVRQFQDSLWGYVELDQGGVEGKRKTRALLESEGLRPIPVYHPLNDGPDYLDELLERYDRICVGNVVMAEADTRRALLSMVWERRRRCKRKVWLHALGYTPNQFFNAYPFNSADSSSHVMAVRFVDTMCSGRAMLAQFGGLSGDGYRYDSEDLQHVERGLPKKRVVLSWIARTEVEAWRRQWADLERVLDAERWPAPLAGEPDPVPAG